MKVDFNRAALADALALLTSVVPSRTPKPILRCVKIAADKKALVWPAQSVASYNSATLKLSCFKPLFAIAKTRLNGLPEYRLM